MEAIFGAILDGFLKAHPFAAEPAALATPLVAATMAIYGAMKLEMLPTPSKSHYTFNLRDISKVQGMLLITPPKCEDADALLRLWCHETQRVFCDRLVSTTDRGWFATKMATVPEKVGKEWAEDDSIALFGST